MMTSWASVEIALAISTICIWATLRVFMTRRGSISIDHFSNTAWAPETMRPLSTRPSLLTGSRPRYMFSATVIAGTGDSSWWIIAMPRPSALALSGTRTCLPLSSMLPVSAW